MTHRELWNTEAIERLFDNSGIGFVVVGLDQHVLAGNSSFCRMLGYDLQELQRMHVFDYTHPADLPMTQTMFAHAADPNVTQVFEKRYIKKNGDTMWCKLRSEPVFDPDGRASCRIVMVEDITQDKLDEINLELMAAITEASDDAIFRADTSGTIQFWGKGAERMYGYSAAEAVGRHASFIAAENMEPQLQRAERKLVRGEVVIDPDAVGRRKDGSTVAVSALVFPLLNKEGNTTAYAAVHRDITAFKQLEQQFRHSQRLETAGMLAGGIAHDFNNILTVIQSASSLLAASIPAGSEDDRHLDLIERSAERATRLTRQLLAFSRKQAIKPVIINPNTHIADCTALIRRALGEHISLEIRPRSTWHVREDSTQLEQVLLNLAVNAHHAMPQGGRLRISTQDAVLHEPPDPEDGWLSYMPTPLEPGAYVLLSVEDNGCGMAEEVLERIFDPFFTTRAPGEGTGLGLSVVYGLVTQVGGGIRVCTMPGRGSRFDVYLPRALAPAEQQVPEPATVVTPRNGRILIVEDDEGVRQLTAALLERAGYTVFQAGNPLDVLEGRVESDVDLILSDVVMPEMSGPDFAERWLERKPGTRFLFMSGYFDEDTFAGRLRDKLLIQKPFKPRLLIETVASELARTTAA